MSGWDFDDVGKFGSAKAAEDFAKRNNVDPRDIRNRDKGDGVELEIRRSSLDGRGLTLLWQVEGTGWNRH